MVDHLLRRGKQVRALVRPGSDALELERKGIEVIRGDMLQPATLPPAMQTMDALITTAIGYSRRRRTDDETTDDIGNRNLINAAQQTGLSRFVFTGVLNAEKATNVPHFHQKARIEDYLEQSGVPFVSIRPPGFIDQVLSVADIEKGHITAPFAADARASIILADDAARYLALSVDTPGAAGHRIPVAAETPVSFQEIAQIISNLTGRSIHLRNPPAWLMKVMSPVLGLFNPMMQDMPAMMDFIASGDYIADTRLQARLFDIRSTEDTLRQWLQAHDLLAQAAP